MTEERKQAQTLPADLGVTLHAGMSLSRLKIKDSAHATAP